nr:MAG TPA: hypothetical protein [Caudoviricetes sp.]
MTVRYHHGQKWRCLTAVKPLTEGAFLWIKTGS